jgi:hypothetical protein
VKTAIAFQTLILVRFFPMFVRLDGAIDCLRSLREKKILPEESSNGGIDGAGKQFVLQRAVQNLCLLDGRKFGLRIHALLVLAPTLGLTANMEGSSRNVISWHWVGYTFREAVLTKAGAVFDKGATDILTHITCTSVQRNTAAFDLNSVKGFTIICIYTSVCCRSQSAGLKSID